MSPPPRPGKIADLESPTSPYNSPLHQPTYGNMDEIRAEAASTATGVSSSR